MICLKEKLFYPLLALFIFMAVYVFVPPSRGWFKNTFDDGIGAARIVKGKKSNQPSATFMANVEIFSVDTEGNKIRGLGKAGSLTADRILYAERDFDLTEAAIERADGTLATINDLSEVKHVYIQGKTKKDGTFSVNKVIIPQ